MAYGKSIALQQLTTKVQVPCTNTKDQALLGKRTKLKPAYKVGKVIWSGGTKIGSFKEKE